MRYSIKHFDYEKSAEACAMTIMKVKKVLFEIKISVCFIWQPYEDEVSKGTCVVVHNGAPRH
jgi:hypothetical protein